MQTSVTNFKTSYFHLSQWVSNFGKHENYLEIYKFINVFTIGPSI